MNGRMGVHKVAGDATLTHKKKPERLILCMFGPGCSENIKPHDFHNFGDNLITKISVLIPLKKKQKLTKNFGIRVINGIFANQIFSTQKSKKAQENCEKQKNWFYCLVHQTGPAGSQLDNPRTPYRRPEGGGGGPISTFSHN